MSESFDSRYGYLPKHFVCIDVQLFGYVDHRREVVLVAPMNSLITYGNFSDVISSSIG